jgi:hypothetical protein
MTKTTPEKNKAIVLEAFETLFNKRDYAAAERFWSAALGRLGGEARARTMSPEQRSETAKRAARARYSKSK